MVHEYKRRIFGYECDIYGHLNNANYLHLYEEARSQFLEDINLPIRRLNELGIAIFVLRVEIDYIKSVELESEVSIKSWIVSGTRLRGLWQQELYMDGQLCSRIVVHGVYASGGKPCRLPKEIYEEIKTYVHPELDFIKS